MHPCTLHTHTHIQQLRSLSSFQVRLGRVGELVAVPGQERRGGECVVAARVQSKPPSLDRRPKAPLEFFVLPAAIHTIPIPRFTRTIEDNRRPRPSVAARAAPRLLSDESIHTRTDGTIPCTLPLSAASIGFDRVCVGDVEETNATGAPLAFVGMAHHPS